MKRWFADKRGLVEIWLLACALCLCIGLMAGLDKWWEFLIFGLLGGTALISLYAK